MVRRLLCSGLALALWAQPCVGSLLWADAARTSSPTAATSAAPLSASVEARTALPALPERPAPVPHVANDRIEDFTAVTLISLPFTTLWALVGALVIGGIAQHQWPPNFDTPLLAGAAAAAVGSSVTIGLVSVQWGGSHLTPSPTPQPTVSPSPSATPQP